MLGFVWVDQEGRDERTRLGLLDHLAYLGIPIKEK
jgi:hypothetical protein